MPLWIQDLALALRRLRRRPAFTSSAVLTLALGVGATVAVFGVAHSVLLRPLPYPTPDRLVRVFQAYPEQDATFGALSRPDFEDWAEAAEGLDGLAAYTGLPSDPTLTGGDRPALLETTWTSGSFFSTLGVEPALGRTFDRGEEARGERLVVLSGEAWQRRFGGDSGVVGRRIELDGEPWTVIGVLPTGAAFPPGTEAWLPLGTIPASSIPRLRMVRFLDVVGRLGADTSVAQAERELTGVAGTLARRYPESNAGADAATVVPLVDHLVGNVRPALLVLFGAVSLMLLIACANVTGLWLVRGLERRRETAMRAALGAGRLRLMREVFAESVLVSVAGSALGVLLALWGGEALVRLGGDLLPRPADVFFSTPSLLFALGLTAACSLLVGLLPAWRATREPPRRHLGTSSRRAFDGRPARLLPMVVVAELILATVLLVGTGLLLRSLGTLLATPTGFDAEGVVAVSLGLPDERYPQREDYLAAHDRLRDRLAALPNVETVASLRHLPLGGDTAESHSWATGGPAGATSPTARLHMASPDLFRTLRVPLLAGRDFTPRDDADDMPVAVVNLSMARRAFGDDAPVGRRLWLGDEPLEVVGVVGDVRHRSLAAAPEPAIYVPVAQVPRRSFTLLLRATPGARVSARGVRDVVWSEDPALALQRVAPLSRVAAESSSRPRFFTLLVSLLAGLAAALAACGIYGVFSYATGLRRHEVGVRLTLGARRGEILRLLVGRGMRWATAGVGLGLAISLPAARLLESQLFEVGTNDPWAYAGAAALLLSAAAWAVFLPARRSASLDPVTTIKTG